MDLKKAKEITNTFINNVGIEVKTFELKEAISTILQELDNLQKENDLAKKALIANSYEGDEINTLLVKIQELQKENEELKKGNEVIDSFPLVRTVKR